MQRIKVLLPDPEEPITEMTSPLRTVRSIPLSTSALSKRFFSPLISSTDGRSGAAKDG
jgi:hypothetical protein